MWPEAMTEWKSRIAIKSGHGKPNQKKSVHELFAGAFRNKSSICEFRACFPKENTRIFTKMGEIHMNFSFWPFLWFGLPGRLLMQSKRRQDWGQWCEDRGQARGISKLILPLSEYGFAYGLKTETRQFSMNFSCEPHREGNGTCLCSSTDRVRFRLFPSTVWAGREYGLDWFRVRFRYPRRWERVPEPHAKQYSDSALVIQEPLPLKPRILV